MLLIIKVFGLLTTSFWIKTKLWFDTILQMILGKDVRFLNSLLKRGNILTYLMRVLINEYSVVLKYKSTIEVGNSDFQK